MKFIIIAICAVFVSGCAINYETGPLAQAVYKSERPVNYPIKVEGIRVQ
jgi:hypothetical protein